MPVSDEILVKRSQEGDYISFEALVKRYEKKIYNLAYRIMGNKEDASDVLQETFLRAFKKLVGFKGKAKFSTWIYRIAVNICLMRKRKEKKMLTFSLDVPILTEEEDEIRRDLSEDWSKNPLATLENKELRKTLSNAVDLLPEEYKTVFLLKGVNGLSNQDVARVLRISLPAVKSRLHRARLFLRDKLSQYFREYGSRA